MNEPLSENTPAFGASNFAARWNAYAERTGLSGIFRPQRFTIDAPDISENTTRFLNDVGLPAGAWLCWDTEFAGRHLLDEYALDVDWSDEDRARLASFRLLGSNAGGDPVVLDMAHDEQVVLLYHEDAFEIGQFINSSVAQLAECILVFHETVEAFRNTVGDAANGRKSKAPLEMVEQALSKVAQIDAKARADNGYWVEAFDSI